jgi:molecular chaperone GrpE (heat shock protein)
MNETSVPRLSKLPFIIGDLLLLAAAGYVALYGAFLGQWQYVAIISAVAIGAWLLAWPFVLEFRAATKLSEMSALDGVTSKIKDLDKVAASIARASAEWQQLQQGATQSVTAAEHIAERMTTEARNFGEVLGRLNEAEKNHLRLEVDKLRRAEGEWLGIVVRTLDHVHALHQAGVRSGQRNVIEQLTHFQHACRDTARRIGVVPVVPEPGVPFDGNSHQLPEGIKPENDTKIGDTLAPGYTFQGQVIRLPVVALAAGGEKKEAAPKKEKSPDPQLSFDQTAG